MGLRFMDRRVRVGTRVNFVQMAYFTPVKTHCSYKEVSLFLSEEGRPKREFG